MTRVKTFQREREQNPENSVRRGCTAELKQISRFIYAWRGAWIGGGAAEFRITASRYGSGFLE